MGCSVEGCGDAVKARGLCRRHYVADRAARTDIPRCAAPGCDRARYCKLLCRGHYARSQRGVPLASPVRESLRGNEILAVRIDAKALEALRQQADAVGLTVNKYAARQLLHLAHGQ